MPLRNIQKYFENILIYIDDKKIWKTHKWWIMRLFSYVSMTFMLQIKTENVINWLCWISKNIPHKFYNQQVIDFQNLVKDVEKFTKYFTIVPANDHEKKKKILKIISCDVVGKYKFLSIKSNVYP